MYLLMFFLILGVSWKGERLIVELANRPRNRSRSRSRSRRRGGRRRNRITRFVFSSIALKVIRKQLMRSLLSLQHSALLCTF